MKYLQQVHYPWGFIENITTGCGLSEKPFKGFLWKPVISVFPVIGKKATAFFNSIHLPKSFFFFQDAINLKALSKRKLSWMGGEREIDTLQIKDN